MQPPIITASHLANGMASPVRSIRRKELLRVMGTPSFSQETCGEQQNGYNGCIAFKYCTSAQVFVYLLAWEICTSIIMDASLKLLKT